MTKEEIFNFIRAHPIFHLATIDGDKPRVRSMTLFRADESGIIFHTSKKKDLTYQLAANPQVELCFSSIQPASDVRVSGTVEREEDMELKNQINPDEPETLAVYRLRNGIATKWTKQTDPNTKAYIEL
ncbi:MAG: pyridoxamine 5'-phosphate oxidase family protein [Chloroflexota bacterium]|nr:pyridoxamine 5'-phosphate oxidase family protein [Chloroflexota bacterium]